MTATCHYLASTLRRGWATLIEHEATGPRATVDVLLRPAARSKSTGELDPDSSIGQTAQLYGPGDILGFHERVVAATTPKPEVGDFEPNYFPAFAKGDNTSCTEYLVPCAASSADMNCSIAVKDDPLCDFFLEDCTTTVVEVEAVPHGEACVATCAAAGYLPFGESTCQNGTLVGDLRCEPGCAAAPPAIVNAVCHALTKFGVSHLDMPLTSEKVWKEIQKGWPK